MATLRPRLQFSRLCLKCRYTTATTPPAPPLLLKIRGDMKDAMRAKDANRLNVLRALLAEYANAAKTSTPIKTNIQLLSLLRKRVAAARAAATEFSAANRNDLKDKEEAQIAVLEEYAGGVKTVGEEEIKTVVGETIAKMRTEGLKLDMGPVLKSLVGPGGALDGRPVEKGEVAKIVRSILQT